MLIVLIARKRFGFGFWIRFNYSRIVNYSELPISIADTSILNKLTTIDNQENEDDDVISIEDVQPATMSPFEALSAIRQLDFFFDSRDKYEDVLHLLAQ